MIRFQGLKFIIISILLLVNHSFGSNIKSTNFRYGQSEGKRSLIANFIHKSGVKPNKVIIITEGVHGNEYIGFADKIKESLLDESSLIGEKLYFKSGGAVLIVPKVNTDGVSLKTRKNSLGQDLNRHFKLSLKVASESEQLMDFLKFFTKIKNLKPLFAIDYHCCAGKVLKANNDDSKEFYRYLNFALKKDLNRDFTVTSTLKVFGKFFKGTLKDYMNTEFKIPSITYEAISLNRNYKNKQRSVLNKIFFYFSDEKNKILALNNMYMDEDKNKIVAGSRYKAYSE